MRELGGIGRIVVERDRARTKWTDAHDDKFHKHGELAEQAAALALNHDATDPADLWGLREKHKGDRIRQLEIAGALIAAEIDRLLRAYNKD